MSSKQRVNNIFGSLSNLAPREFSHISPLKIGFVASFVLHSSLFAFLVVDFRRVHKEPSMPSQAMSLSLENISGEAVDSRKMKRHHKKHRHHHRKPPREANLPAEKFEKQEFMEQEIAENSEDSELDSTMASSANVGEKIEILGSGDALYASILDIINKNRGNYPKMARIKRLQDRIQVEFVLLTSGEVVGIRVLHGRHRILNDDAIAVIKRSAGQFPKMERSKKIRLMLKYDLDLS